MPVILLFIFLAALQPVSAQTTDQRCFELRIYYCHPGKLNDLVQRFTNHTTRIFEKHGMTNIGYWLPINNADSALYYILAYPSRAARDSSWKAFGADPEWKQVAGQSEANGKIVAKVVSTFLAVSDVSPVIQPSVKSPERTFELRTYTCNPGKLPTLITRFRDHTLKLFEKHGMTNIAYWTTVEKDTTQPKLVYLLAHASEEAGKNSFKTFVADPAWISARDNSEKDGKIIEKLESVYMKPLPFSKLR
ncbi:NIPSNAP family protein [Paraflavitalea pollutisoli]|uniref:NIPSNAP family protein n=1 Tax=Paraflavitalea pollutisoli TaxID=3034143 RepID=UPI0023EAE76E|nr:NIPSNAP family protein [Paraflavitalea sp. H1-2-19X]